MASTIKVDNVQDQPGTNIVSKCGTDVTLGASGDTVALASGASQTGFGRTGTVDWVTTVKTTGFTAVSGNGYFCDTADSGAFTLTLPTSPSAGDIVGLKDYNGNFSTANLTIGRGGQPINGANSIDPVISTAGAAIFLVYVDGSQGWVATQDDSSTFSGASYVVATGGTITTSGNDKIHTFTGPGTFTVCSVSVCAANNLVSYLVVAGGAGGGLANEPGGGYSSGAGGGAGGYRELKSPTTPYTASPLDGYPSAPNRITVTATGYPIAVGGGGGGSSSFVTPGTAGVNSSGLGITSAGGGGGASQQAPLQGVAGGSGGGGAYQAETGGAGNTPPTTPAQGNAGGDGNAPGCYPSLGANSGGGGGATAAGDDTSRPKGGDGGAGATSSIDANPTARAGGGGGGAYVCGISGPAGSGAGGTGGGGPGACAAGSTLSAPGTAGTANTGGGGGGGSTTGPDSGPSNGAGGGSGIVIIRYKYQ